MKSKHFILLILGFLNTTFIFGQDPMRGEFKGDQLMALKTGIITQALSLSPEQAQSFWPIYNQFNEQITESRRELGEILKEAKPKDIDEWNDEKVEATLKLLAKHKQDEQRLINQMQEALREVISPKQLLKLHMSEERFKHRIIERLKTRRRG
jgi:Spy/CpxP family protein refolding chaperone